MWQTHFFKGMSAFPFFIVGMNSSQPRHLNHLSSSRTLPPDGKMRQPWSSSSSVSSASSASTTRSPPRSPYRPNPSDPNRHSGVTSSQSVSSLPPQSILNKAKTNGEMTSSTPELASTSAQYQISHSETQAEPHEGSMELSRNREVSKTVPVSVAQTSRIVEEPMISPQTESVVEASVLVNRDRSPSPDTLSVSCKGHCINLQIICISFGIRTENYNLKKKKSLSLGFLINFSLVLILKKRNS